MSLATLPSALPRSHHRSNPARGATPARLRPLWGALAAAALGLAAPAVSAQVFKDAAFDGLYRTERITELEQLAHQRLATRADDAQAVLAAGIVAMTSADSAKHEAAIQRAELCIEKAPQAAACHYVLGAVTGVRSMAQGPLKVITNVGNVRRALEQALVLEPTWYTARSAMVEFYLQAPGFVGGGEDKAAAAAAAAVRPEQVRVLQARVAMKDKRYAEALEALAQVQPGADTAVLDDQLQWWLSAGIGLMGQGKRDEARAAFERLSKAYPDAAMGPYGLARWHTEAGSHVEALKYLQQCAQLKGAGRLPLDYRLGIALQAMGRTDDARAAYNRFIAGGRGAPGALDDAKQRLKQLG